MQISNISDFTKGWFIGNFEPTLLKTPYFEVGIILRAPGEETPHVHKLATEYNVLISGTMSINGIELTPGTSFIIEPFEWVKPTYHEHCTIVCVKTPSVPGDKYEE